MKFELGLFEAPVRRRGGRASAARGRPRPGARGRPRVDRAARERRDAAAARRPARRSPSSGPTPTARATCWATTRTSPTSRRCWRCATNPIGFPVPDDLSLSDELEGRSTILDAIRERCAGGAEVRFAAGGGILDASDAEIEEAAAAARGADVAIVVVGERSGLTLRLHLRRDARPHGARAAGPPGGARRRRGRDRHAGRARARRRPAAGHPGGGRARGRRRQRVGAGRRGARGDRRDPLRRRRPRRQAPGHRAPPRRPGPDLLRAQAVGRALALARRLRRRLAPAAVAVRPRALLHALRAARPRARPHDARARRRGGDRRRGRERRRARGRRGRPALRARRGGERHAAGQGAARLPARAPGAGRAPARDLPPGRRAARLHAASTAGSCSSPAACG